MKRVYASWYEGSVLTGELTSLTEGQAKRLASECNWEIRDNVAGIISLIMPRSEVYNLLDNMTPFHNGNENIRIMNIMMLLSETKDAFYVNSDAREEMLDIWKSMPDVYGEFHPYLEHAWNECTNHVVYDGGIYHVDDWFDI